MGAVNNIIFEYFMNKPLSETGGCHYEHTQCQIMTIMAKIGNLLNSVQASDQK